MSNTIENDLAFPATVSYSDEDPNVMIASGGLTKREYFSAIAMQGFYAEGGADIDFAQVAQDSVAAADALILELNKTKP